MSNLNKAITLINSAQSKSGNAALNDLAQADDLLEVSLANEPSNELVFLNWGYLYLERARVYSNGNDHENKEECMRLARDMFTTAVQLNPNLAEAKKKLDSLA